MDCGYSSNKPVADPYAVRVVGKKVVGDELRHAFVQGELAAQMIVFTLDKIVDGVDISAANFQINGLNSRNQSAFQALGKTIDPSEDTFTLTWTVGSQFTAESGRLLLWLNAVTSQEDPDTGEAVVDLNWQTKPKEVFVQDGFIVGDYVGVTEQLLIDIATMLGRAEQAATNSEGSAVRSESSAQAANRSASDADGSKLAAQASEANARASEVNAGASESAARDSATQAAQSAGTALQKAIEADMSANRAAANVALTDANATRAETAAERAELSEYNADVSASNAHESEVGAAAAAENAARRVLLSWAALRDPTSGQIATVQTILDNLFALHSLPITAADFDALVMTAADFDALILSAYAIDTNGKNILI